MKKIIFILSAIAFFGANTVNAQEVAAKAKVEVTKTKKAAKAKKGAVATLPKVEGAGMVFENETIDYGTIAHNADGKREFVLTNNGNKPLIITNAQGSCGCTVPTTPKDPIAPGAKAVIGVKYATDRVGPFTKTVTVSSNAEGIPTKILTIKGTVLPDATPSAPAGTVLEPVKS
ncbi:DUF1573 domain-containing protein [Flavobacterium sp.]|uniref:DUF1573 domain-containing protein n=1 Tax=Flavobacterium sp. TaxID=239 RepID=UPI003751F744